MPNSNNPAHQTEQPLTAQTNRTENSKPPSDNQAQAETNQTNPDQQEQNAQTKPQPQARKNQQQTNQKQPDTNQSQPDKNQKQPGEQTDQRSQYSHARQAESRIAPGIMKPMPEEEILKWQAPSRPFKKRDKKFFSTIIIIAVLVSLILFFAGQVLPVAVVVAVVFLVYVLSVVPPQEVTNKLTTYGIRIENTLYYWEELGRFWFTQQFDKTILNIETVRFPGRITLLLPEEINREDMRIILSEVLLNQKPEPTLYEQAAQWLKEKIPLDES